MDHSSTQDIEYQEPIRLRELITEDRKYILVSSFRMGLLWSILAFIWCAGEWRASQLAVSPTLAMTLVLCVGLLGIISKYVRLNYQRTIAIREESLWIIYGGMLSYHFGRDKTSSIEISERHADCQKYYVLKLTDLTRPLP